MPRQILTTDQINERMGPPTDRWEHMEALPRMPEGREPFAGYNGKPGNGGYWCHAQIPVPTGVVMGPDTDIVGDWLAHDFLKAVANCEIVPEGLQLMIVRGFEPFTTYEDLRMGGASEGPLESICLVSNESGLVDTRQDTRFSVQVMSGYRDVYSNASIRAIAIEQSPKKPRPLYLIGGPKAHLEIDAPTTRVLAAYARNLKPLLRPSAD